MKFFVKRFKHSKAEGPFTTDIINESVRKKSLTHKSLAIPDTGQGLEEAANTARHKWIHLADIPGFVPDPDEEKNLISISLVILLVLALAVIIGLVELMNILHRIE